MAIGMGVGAVGFLTLTAATAAIPYAWLMVPMAAAAFSTGFRLAMAVAGAAYLGGLALAVSHPRAREPVTAMAWG
jgi:hypothetical protein